MAKTFDPSDFKKNFPIFDRTLPNGQQLVYLDNCATTQRPKMVIDAISEFYYKFNSNVHRGLYDFSERATDNYENARVNITNYFNAGDPRGTIFVRGTTEAINLVCQSYCKKNLKKGDEILVGAAEHHANYLPWQTLEHEIGIVRKIIPLRSDFSLDIDKYSEMFSPRTKFVAIQHVSNVLGTKNDIKKMTEIAHSNGAKILIDGAESLAFAPPNLGNIDCDFFACSAHKGFGPMGVGILFGKYDLLEQMDPYQTGGNIVNKVYFDHTTYKLPPHKFEPGTPNVAGIIGLGATIAFLKTVDWQGATSHLNALTHHCQNTLGNIPSIKLYGTPNVPIFSFNLSTVHCHDVATYLATKGIAVRAGTHCAQPLMQILGCPGTVRLSATLYNTVDEIDFAAEAIAKCSTIFN